MLDTLDRLGVKPFAFDGLTKGGHPFRPTPRGPALLMKSTKRYLVRVGNRFVEQVP